MPKIHYARLKFLRNFPVDGEVANLLWTCLRRANKYVTSWQQVVVMEFRKRRDTTDTTDFCPRQLVTDLLRGNWCNGYWI